MFPVSGEAAVKGDHSPIVVKHGVIFRAQGKHRLNRENGPFLNERAAARPSFVREIRLFVHGVANTVAAVTIHDEKIDAKLVFGTVSCLLKSVRNVRQAIARDHRLESFSQNPCRGVVKRGRLGGQIAHTEGPRAVSYPTVKRCAAVDGD